MSKLFPIMRGSRIKTLPWDMLSMHEAQAERNHGQTLQRLAERGGLSPQEALAVMLDSGWSAVRHMKVAEAEDWLLQMVEVFEKK